ncbi:MAG: cupin domain-containing protein [Clostridia bacterium]|nr:cupin domain-containing protein [Clostridia bacterium]
MQIKKLSDFSSVGAPLYDMRVVLNETGGREAVKFSVITFEPHVRVPETGESVHTEDEYSFFIEGSLYTESGETRAVVSAGDVTLIPAGERHFCENRSDEKCTLVCVMVK